jgi:hypothetical protein
LLIGLHPKKVMVLLFNSNGGNGDEDDEDVSMPFQSTLQNQI